MQLNDLSRSQLEWLINEYILGRRDRQICRLRFIDKLTYEQLAEEINMSARHVRRIIENCKVKMIKHMVDVPLNRIS